MHNIIENKGDNIHYYTQRNQQARDLEKKKNRITKALSERTHVFCRIAGKQTDQINFKLDAYQ